MVVQFDLNLSVTCNNVTASLRLGCVPISERIGCKKIPPLLTVQRVPILHITTIIDDAELL